MRAPSLASIALAVSIATQAGDPVEQARRDLAGRLQLDVDAVTVVSLNEVAWPDTSLGCPQPGMSYGQVITGGRRLLLRAGDGLYAYHAGGDGEFFFCAKPAGSIPPAIDHLTRFTPCDGSRWCPR